MLDKRKFLFNSIIFNIIIFSVTVNAQQVDTDPKQVIVTENQSVNLLCRFGKPIDSCSIDVPGEQTILLRPQASRDGLTYYGQGFEAGQCGVTIDRIQAKHNGVLRCNLGSGTYQYTGYVDIIVAVAPQPPEIEIFTSAVSRNNALEVDKEFSANCISRDGRPAANLSWFLDDEHVYEGVLETQISANTDQRNRTLFTAESQIRRYIRADDNGKTLTCRAEHYVYENGYVDARTQLNVNYRPQALPAISIYGLILDRTAFINVTVRANPRPRIEWIIDGQSITEGRQVGRYEAYQPQNLGYGAYNVTLSIAGLTLEDTTRTYRLKASNEFGQEEYTVRISSLAAIEDSGIGIGGIVGIILACLIVVAAVVLVIVARATGRWCFAGASLNTDIGPDSEAGINPQSSEDEQHPNDDQHHQSADTTDAHYEHDESDKKIRNGKQHENGNGKLDKTNTSV
uniref:Putative cell adhesion molecule 4 n=1 Tax=Corethrella appendiculata TaxID=1370023 RepID=U5EPA2_9DIPT